MPTTTVGVFNTFKPPANLANQSLLMVGTSLMDSQLLSHHHDHSYSRMQEGLKHSAPSIPLSLSEHLYCKLQKPVQVEASTSGGARMELSQQQLSIGQMELSQQQLSIGQPTVGPFRFREHSYCSRSRIQELEEAPLKRSLVEDMPKKDESLKSLLTQEHSYCCRTYTFGIVPFREHSYCRPHEYLKVSYRTQMALPCSTMTSA